jgi:hypothetical protein
MFTAQALQIALVHLCFNVIGIVLFYPLPFMRWPIHMARALGDITSRYRLVKKGQPHEILNLREEIYIHLE